ncbi:nitrogen assimilation transcription factor nit-4 [Fusarium beomiforme]|uniref:Nitrogen assimilation transcription factor nit-4 n=1 Tax=Fusarium beomiforme TaxID=44412 RepID=A0A9P5AGL5_9HYPO|nr:nitrogen assimilation transcription factor nit-4 [Fusarium beomiforme]
MDDNPASASSSSSGRFRTLLPGPTREGDSSRPPSKLSIPKRTSVKTACQACRQRKAKVCNGQRPRCSGCIAAGRECHYASNPYEAEAAAIKRKHEELKERMIDHESLYTSLKNREPHETDEILRRIRAGKDLKSVAEDLQSDGLITPMSRQQAHPLLRNDNNTSNSATTSGSASPPTFSAARMSFSHPQQQTYARPTASSGQPGHGLEEAWPEAQHRTSDDSTIIGLPGLTLPLSRWTNVLQDDKFLTHLLLLFWTWDTACNRIIDRTIFEDDLKNLDPTTLGAPSELRFCSPFLVNALLAVSCLYSTNPITFSIPDELSTRGQLFAQEAIRCLKVEDKRPSLPVVQGLALILMQTRYMALRLDDIYRSTDTAIAGSRQRAEAHALSSIQWGFYVWDWTENPEYWWFPDPVSAVPQRSMKREIFEAECNFTEITEQVLQFLMPLEQGISPCQNSGRAAELYSKIMEWKFSLPEELRAENAVLPSAILLHLAADLVVISILQPFDHVPKSIFGPFHPRLTSYAHATNAMSTIWHFRALYTLRNEFWLIQASSVCAFKVLFAIEESPIQLETFIKACRALMELREAYPVAEDVVYSIESVIKNKKVNLPSYAKEYMPNGAGDGVGDLKGVKVRDHSVIVEKADRGGSEDRLTMTGLLSTLAPSEMGL